MKRLYTLVRDLHLLSGLFASPFVLLFAVSVLILNHAREPLGGLTPVSAHLGTLKLPAGIELLKGRDQVNQVKSVLAQAGVAGEIDFVRFLRRERRLIIPVKRPGLETTVDLQLDTGLAAATRRRTGIWGSLTYLHKSPGPHNVNIRGNWFWTELWRWAADATVYLVLFLSLSGVYLWAVLTAERRAGLLLLGAGAISFCGLIYGLCF